jgi:hypothetical protein
MKRKQKPREHLPRCVKRKTKCRYSQFIVNQGYPENHQDRIVVLCMATAMEQCVQIIKQKQGGKDG